MNPNDRDQVRRWRVHFDMAKTLPLLAIVLSMLSSYRSYLYVKQDLQVTASEVSYDANEGGGLYMKVAFSNAGNRDAAVLRAEPTLWTKDTTSKNSNSEKWLPLSNPVDPHIPVTVPLTPFTVKAGGVEVVTLSVTLDPSVAEGAANQSKTFIGMSVSTMASDGSLYHLEHPVARLSLDSRGQVNGAEAMIIETVNGFLGITVTPSGVKHLQVETKRPIVWAAAHYRVEARSDAEDCREAPTNAPCPSGLMAVETSGQK
jgi:hypothetical protein